MTISNCEYCDGLDSYEHKKVILTEGIEFPLVKGKIIHVCNVCFKNLIETGLAKEIKDNKNIRIFYLFHKLISKLEKKINIDVKIYVYQEDFNLTFEAYNKRYNLDCIIKISLEDLCDSYISDDTFIECLAKRFNNAFKLKIESAI